MNYAKKKSLCGSGRCAIWLTVCLLTFLTVPLMSQSAQESKIIAEMDREITRLMDKGDIPGLSMILVRGEETVIRNYGYTDIEAEKPVNDHTLFELASNSKPFTAIAVMKLVREGKINLEEPVNKYLPWLDFTVGGEKVQPQLGHFLHHTSGVPWTTISGIPVDDTENALENTIRTLDESELNRMPGTLFEYATINYDVLALVISEVTGMTFEDYLQEHVLKALALSETTVGYPKDSSLMATGHKIGFFEARKYQSPVFKGNNAAGYVISSPADMGKWLRHQLGLIRTPVSDIIESTHVRDETVPLHAMASYAGGWNIELDGSGRIYHSGTNPGFTSFVIFDKDKDLGIALLANSNSAYTTMIATRLMDIAVGGEPGQEYEPADGGDKLFSTVSMALWFFTLIVMIFIGMVVRDILGSKRTFDFPGIKNLYKIFTPLLLLSPFAYGLYILPEAVYGFTWEALLVWNPMSLMMLIYSIGVAVAAAYFAYVITLFFKEENVYKRAAPQILLMSVLSGLSNVLVIIMVTAAIGSAVETKYLVFYYALVISIYLLGRRFVQISLIRFARGLVFDLRVKLIDKIFSTSYEKFEKMDRGRVYTAMNDDVSVIGQSTNMFVTLVTSIITAVGAFLYLAFIAFWATALTLLLILTLSAIYHFVSQRANPYFEEARDSQNVFMSLLNGMIDGFKEISLHRNKKLEFKDDITGTAREFKEKIRTADIKFTNAFLVGESLLIVLLGGTAIGMSEIFPDIELYTIMSFVVVLLYLIGPINGILGSVPYIMQLRIAYARVQMFIREIPANMDLSIEAEPVYNTIDSLRAENITYQFANEEGEKDGFKVGPVNLEVSKGEILFIIGGNGSGKTTLAKMLTGLYQPDSGCLWINDQKVKNYELSEYYSTVFAVPHLFDKLYEVDTDEKKDEIDKYLKLLDLDKKVSIGDGKYSTISLSGGQRKRLALLQCYLEDSPVYLFDEWAADQDPTYRKFFYRTLLPEMRRMGKIVIAITHDDHYFDVADKVVKLEAGKLDIYTGGNMWNVMEEEVQES